MAKNASKQGGSSSSSYNNNHNNNNSNYSARNPAASTISELFEPKPSSSSSILNSVFGPTTSMGRGRESTNHGGNAKHAYGVTGNGAQVNKGENIKNSIFETESIDQPGLFSSSSVYYGGQEAYSPTTSDPYFKKDSQDEDPNSAARGNWWQGSLYY